jgi:hypothetical protein
VESWLDAADLSNFEPIPVKLLDGRPVMTDGHTRAVAALRAGLVSVPLVWDEDELPWDLYRACVAACREQAIESPGDLLPRIISEEEYREKWDKWCDNLHERIKQNRVDGRPDTREAEDRSIPEAERRHGQRFHIDGEAFAKKTAIGEGSFYRMVKPVAFFHGSVIGGLHTILANAKSHVDGRKVAYFTTDRVYALVCCRSRQENFVTIGSRDGIQHYFERFPDQLKVMYDGKEGFLYRPVSSANLKNTKGRTWESPVDVPVVLQEHILNIYDEILSEEAAGNVIIHRYAEIDPDEQKMHANNIRDHLNDPVCAEYREFLYQHFSPLWD